MLGSQQLLYMEPHDAGPGAALGETGKAELGGMALYSHLSPLALPSRSMHCLAVSRWAVSPSWGWGRGLLLLIHRPQPALFHLLCAHKSPGILLKCTDGMITSGLGLNFCIPYQSPRGCQYCWSASHTLIGRGLYVGCQPGNMLVSPGEILKYADAGTHSRTQ